ncbi:MAG: hypothetical protein JNM00_11760 [Flavobacteriales bacterium]|nr:hypothetical protein [Flavobacteriales bacterium]
MGEIFLDELNVLREHLHAHERILWTGKPRQGIVFTKADFFMIPFSVFWLGFAVTWTVIAFNAAPFFGLFGLPFVAVGCMMAFGRFIRDRKLRAQTIYALTDSRVILFRNGKRAELVSFDLHTLSYSEFRENGDGSGTIFLSQPLPFAQNFRALDWSQSRKVPALEQIQDVRAVYQKIMTAQRNRRSSAAPPSASASAAE